MIKSLEFSFAWNSAHTKTQLSQRETKDSNFVKNKK